VNQFGARNWKLISEAIGTRNPRQCGERWNNYVNPELRKDPFTPEEDEILQHKVVEFGLKWHKIAKFFHKRSENSLRNRWTTISKMKIKDFSFFRQVIQKQIINQPILFPEVHGNDQEENFLSEIIMEEKIDVFEEFNGSFENISQQIWEEFNDFHF
jgi:GTPase Era involved in 16S rRNA processing